ncbi:MAG: sulfurtransferase TusA family protein [Elusimicrobia bacterium]|nr:sulfurtransferase TusA family protein [Candidatus Liberimonas magnetica]
MKASKTLDCTGLFCPMPIVKTKMELETMAPGEVLEILADDPGFEKDLPSWCKVTGEKFIEMKKEGDILKGYVQKK